MWFPARMPSKTSTASVLCAGGRCWMWCKRGSLAVIPRAEHHHHSSPSSLPLGCSRAGAAGGRKGTGAPDAALPSLPRLRGSCNTFHFAIPFFVFFLLLLFFPCASVVSPAAVLFLQVNRGSVGITCPGNAASLGG